MAELARKIGMIIERRGLTQCAAAELLEIDQPKVSALTRGRLAGFSLDRLVRFLVLLGSDVEIVVKPRARTACRARVMVGWGGYRKLSSTASLLTGTFYADVDRFNPYQDVVKSWVIRSSKSSLAFSTTDGA